MIFWMNTNRDEVLQDAEREFFEMERMAYVETLEDLQVVISLLHYISCEW